jgi:hypothetical protein
MNYLPGLALNCDPPDLSLPSSKIIGMSHWCLAIASLLTCEETAFIHILQKCSNKLPSYWPVGTLILDRYSLVLGEINFCLCEALTSNPNTTRKKKKKKKEDINGSNCKWYSRAVMLDRGWTLYRYNGCRIKDWKDEHGTCGNS